MEWQEIISGAGSATSAGVLAYVAFKLWGKVEQLLERNDRLSEARVQDLKEIIHESRKLDD